MPEEVLQKTCRICKTAKPIEQFYKSSQNADGHVTTCTVCYPSLRRMTETSCTQCGTTKMRALGEIKEWSGLCRKCSNKESANRPDQKQKKSECSRKQVIQQGGIPNARHFTADQVRGSANNRWRGGLPKCVDCNKQLTHMDTQYCRECYVKYLKTKPQKRIAHLKHVPRGKNHHWWKGGKYRGKARRNNAPQRKFRRDVLARDGNQCVHCGVSNVPLQVDHILPVLTHPELELDLDNGRTLCIPCHRKTDTYGLKAHLFALTLSNI